MLHGLVRTASTWVSVRRLHTTIHGLCTKPASADLGCYGPGPESAAGVEGGQISGSDEMQASGVKGVELGLSDGGRVSVKPYVSEHRL